MRGMRPAVVLVQGGEGSVCRGVNWRRWGLVLGVGRLIGGADGRGWGLREGRSYGLWRGGVGLARWLSPSVCVAVLRPAIVSILELGVMATQLVRGSALPAGVGRVLGEGRAHAARGVGRALRLGGVAKAARRVLPLAGGGRVQG